MPFQEFHMLKKILACQSRLHTLLRVLISHEPTDGFNPILINEAEASEEDSTIGTYFELNLKYAEASFVVPVDEDIQPLNPDMSQLQKECEDFKAIYHYLRDKILPNDEKHAKFVVCEANQYVLKDGTGTLRTNQPTKGWNTVPFVST